MLNLLPVMLTGVFSSLPGGLWLALVWKLLPLLCNLLMDWEDPRLKYIQWE